MGNYSFAIERFAHKISPEMKRIFLIGALAVVGVATVVTVPILAHRKEEALRNWHDLPQSQRELRAPTSQQLDAIFPDGARQVLEASPQLTLFSIVPGAEDYDAASNDGKVPLFHDHWILGQTVIRDPAAKAALLARFYDGFVAPPDPRERKQIGFGCFNPRHGLRATLNGKTADLLICFECRQVETYINGKSVSHKNMNAAPAEKFNEILTAACVPLSPK